MSKEQTQDSMKAEEGVYLIFKNYTKSTNEIFDYSSIENNDIQNTFITEKTFIFKSENNIIKEFKDKELALEDDNLLLTIMRNEEGFYINNSNFQFQQIEQLRNVKNYLWYVINSDNKEIINPNEDYYMTEGDIIKIGRVIYFVKEILIYNENNKEGTGKIENNEKIKDEKINNFIPEIKEYKKCDFCNEILFKLCKCKEYQHIDCIKNWIENTIIITKNKKETVQNYYFNIYYCDEYISKDPNCIDSECKNCKCVKCNTYYPLKIKYNFYDENLKKNEIKYQDFYQISKPEKSSYMILESLEYTDEYKNKPQIIKAIHVIKLIEGDIINIGSDDNSDVIVNHSSVSKNHAIIKYNNGLILLKNESKKAGTLALFKEERFYFSETEVYLQVDKTFITAKIMNKYQFSLLQNGDKKTHQIIIVPKKSEENSNIINSNNEKLKNPKNELLNPKNDDNKECQVKNRKDKSAITKSEQFYGEDF